jgi:Fe-S cluster biogenesis protein NfuA
MKARIEEILAAVRPGIEGDGGIVEQLSPAEDGSIRIHLKEKCRGCLATMWTHRLRVERAIKEAYPEATILFVTTRDQAAKDAE